MTPSRWSLRVHVAGDRIRTVLNAKGQQPLSIAAFVFVVVSVVQLITKCDGTSFHQGVHAGHVTVNGVERFGRAEVPHVANLTRSDV